MKREFYSINDIRKICKSIEDGTPLKELCESLGKDSDDEREMHKMASLRSRIKNGELHRDISEHYNFANARKVCTGRGYRQYSRESRLFNDNDARDIVKLLMGGAKARNIAYVYHCSPNTIYDIQYGRSYKDVSMTVPGYMVYLKRINMIVANRKTKKRTNYRLDEDTVREFCRYLEKTPDRDFSMKEACDIIGVDYYVVKERRKVSFLKSQILRKKRWVKISKDYNLRWICKGGDTDESANTGSSGEGYPDNKES